MTARLPTRGAIAISEPNTYFDRAVPVLVESLARQGRLDDGIAILEEQQVVRAVRGKPED
ncbi:hypothetical protein ACQP2Y_12500 [Actinoplanes sp. CA-051413]|uniref:hypothetical protein n=1 Tax=Actinoplanes sp. CA-051413 TaxID=3239899 RepID=UPI003D99553F